MGVRRGGEIDQQNVIMHQANLLLNTCNFHRKFRLIFSLVLSENVPNVDFREAKFQNFPGEHAP